MVFAQGQYQPGALRGPQWRQAPLNGITISGAGVKGLQLMAGPGPQRPGAGGGIEAPMAGRLSGRRPARTA
jgi:hypothetical protein